MPRTTTSESPVLNLKEKRALLSEDELQLVRRIMIHIEEQFIDSFDELIAGVRVSDKQASFSPTISLNKAKLNNLKVKVDARVRAPREALEFEARLTDDNQLALGWEQDPDVVDDSTDPPGFDDSMRAGLLATVN
jgi:hypothetical protein